MNIFQLSTGYSHEIEESGLYLGLCVHENTYVESDYDYDSDVANYHTLCEDCGSFLVEDEGWYV